MIILAIEKAGYSTDEVKICLDLASSEFYEDGKYTLAGEGKILSSDYIVMKLRTALFDLFADNYSSAIIDLNVETCDYVLTTNALGRDKEKFFKDKNIYLIPHKTYHQEYFNVKGYNDEVFTLPEKAIKL